MSNKHNKHNAPATATATPAPSVLESVLQDVERRQESKARALATPAPQDNAPAPCNLAEIYNQFSALLKSDSARALAVVESARAVLATAEAEYNRVEADDNATKNEYKKAVQERDNARAVLVEAENKYTACTAGKAIPETDVLQAVVFLSVFYFKYDYKQAELQVLADNVLGITEADKAQGRHASLGQYGYFKRCARAFERAGIVVEIRFPATPAPQDNAPATQDNAPATQE